jgi:hypothetical protein
MSEQLIRYTTKPEHAVRNEELIGAVFAELRQTRPDGPTRDSLIPIGSYRVFNA